MTQTLRHVACLLLVCLLTIGCAAQRYMQRGDDAWASGDAVRAEAYYNRAISADPSLLRDEGFATHYRHVESRSEFTQAQRLVRQNQHGIAISHLTKALRLDPAYDEAQALLATAKVEHARQLHRDALKAADTGDESQTARLLAEAQQLDPRNGDVDAALASLRRPLPQNIVQLQLDQHWQQASEALDGVIRRNPSHVNARLARSAAQKQIGEANRAHARGTSALNEKKLGEAIEQFNAALDIWPNHRSAQANLAEANQQLAEVDALADAAARHRAAEQWDSALADLGRALAIYPQHPRSNQLLRQTKQDAADAYVADGRARLAGGDLNAAEASFERARAYLPSHAAIGPGLADVAIKRGELAERHGVLGIALLWYDHAAALHGSASNRAAAARVKSAMFAQIAFRLSTETRTGRNAAPGDAEDIERRTAAAIDRDRPAFIELAAGAKPADYHAEVTVASFSIREVLKQSERRRHHYIEVVKAPNPAIPHLRKKLHYAQAELRRLQRYYDSLGHHHSHGHHLDDKDKHDAHERKRRRAKRALDHQRREVGRIAYELECAPAYVDQQHDAYVAYTLSTYEKQGETTAALRFIDPVADKVLKSLDVSKSALDRDTTIDRPAPELGLQPDDLQLVSDRTMAADLVRNAGDELAAQIIDCAVRARANAFIDRAESHRRAGKTLLAADARVYAAVTLETVDAKRAGSDLQKLLEEQREAVRRAADAGKGGI